MFNLIDLKKSVLLIGTVIIVTGCATHDEDAALQIVPSIPAPFLPSSKSTPPPETQQETISNAKAFYEANDVYREIAEGVASRGVLSSAHMVQSARYSRQQFLQTLLPQISPVGSVDDNGNAVGRLQVEQVIFDGGRFRAGRQVLTAEQSIAFAEFAIQFNERVGTAIDAYLRHDRARSLTAASEEISERYKVMQSRAQQRLRGGIGNRSELSLFELKQFEAITEAARDKADAQSASLEVRELTGKTITSEPPTLSFDGEEAAVPPIVALAVAERQRASGELWSEKAARLPRLTARGSVGVGTNLGLGFDDRANSFVAGIQLGQPLTWGRDYGLKASRSEARAAAARLNEAKRDADVQLKTLNLRIIELSSQLIKNEQLLKQAKARVDDFDAQFLGGSSSIIEAVGIIDTYKRILRSKIETRHLLLSAQREKVQLLGLLGPYAIADQPSVIIEQSAASAP